MKIGVLGGTFDPIHLGHLAVAAEARQVLSLGKVLFMPAGQPYFKESSSISSAEDRVKMLELATADEPAYQVSRLETERSGPSFAVDSIETIRKQLNPRDEVFFIMGWDSLMSLPLWHEADRLIKLCRIVAAPRPGYPQPDLKSLEPDLPGIAGRAVVMERPLIDISATLIRERVRRGLPIDGLVSPAVAAYVREKGLYKGRAEALNQQL
jgi:nicotinate-nucleotide adenylyltransferase